MSTIINPLTNKPFVPEPDKVPGLFVAVEAVRTIVKRNRQGIESERIVFECPCGRRNNQSVHMRKALPAKNVAVMRCTACGRLLHVLKSAVLSAKPKIERV